MSDEDAALVLERLVAVEVELFDAADAALRNRLDGMRLVALLPLRVIASRPECRVQELAAGLGISVGGASKSADRLECAGWIRRVAHPLDRRSSTLELTVEGRERLAAANAVVSDVVRERVIDVLGPRDADRLSTALGRIRVGIPARPSRDDARPPTGAPR